MKINEIYCGDALYLIKQLDDNSVDHVITSPPYNRKRNDKYSFYSDTINDYYAFLDMSIAECLRVSKKYVFFNIQQTYYNRKDVHKIIGKYSDKIQDMIIWGKTNPMPASGNSITNSFEYIIVFGNIPLKSNQTYTKNLILTSVNSNMPSIHKAVMKPEVCSWLVDKFTKENEVILDPFMGVGTTALTAKQLNRNFLGFELSETYVNYAKKQLETQSNISFCMFD